MDSHQPLRAMITDNRKIFRKFCVIQNALLLLALPAFVQAEDVNWVTGNGSLNSAGSWSSNPNLPGAEDNVFFSFSSALTITSSGSLTNATASFEGAAPNYHMNLGVSDIWTLTSGLSVNMASGGLWRVNSGTISVTNENGNATATFGSADTRGSLRFDGGTLEVDVLNVTGAAGSNNQGLIANSGRLDVLNGSTITTPHNLVFGAVTGNTFTANFLGGTNSFTAPSTWIGGNGKGIVTVGGAQTTLSLNGTSLLMGGSATGGGSTLTINQGAKVTSNLTSGVAIGNNASASGNIMTVTGAGSDFTMTTGNFAIGTSSANNELIVSDGGSVHLTEGRNTYIGQGANASGNTLTVTGENSLYQTGTTETSSYIAVGFSGDDNELVVTDGGRVSTYQLFVGFSAGATGNSVTVTNGGVLEVAGGGLVTNHDVSNTITVSDGGVLQFTTATPLITTNSGAGGDITLGNGGVVSFRGVSNVSAAPVAGLTYSGESHTLRLDDAQNASVATQTFGDSGTYSRLELRNNGTWNSSGTLIIGNGGELTGSGTVNGDVNVQSGGLLAIGESPGTMTFNDNLILESGSVSAFEIDGLTGGLFDLAQGGDGTQTVTFDGTLNLIFGADFDLLGDVQLFDFENYLGNFAEINITGLADGYFAEFNALNGVVTVTVIPEPGTWAFVGLGLGAIILRALPRRRLS